MEESGPVGSDEDECKGELSACISLLTKGSIALKGLNQKRHHTIEFSTTGAISQGEAY